MNTSGFRYLTIISCITLFIGCAADQPAIQEPVVSPFPTPAEEGKGPEAEDIPSLEIKNKEAYIIGPDDILQISVWRHDDADAEATVDFNGNISLPIIGVCKAEGFNPRELMRNIAGRLARYYKNPLVRLVVSRYNNRRVYLLGEFETPGVQILGGKSTLLDLISNRGGVTENANLSRCTIVRGRGMMILIDLNELLHRGNMELNIDIHPNDFIYLPDNRLNQVYVFGEIERPGLYPLHADFTVVDAVMTAGGTTKDAALSRTMVFRGNRENPEEIPIDLDDILKEGDRKTNIFLHPQDIVYVPNRFMAKVNYYIQQVLPAIQTIVLTDQASSALNLK